MPAPCTEESEALDDVVRRAGFAARRDGEDKELVLRRIVGEEDAKRAIAAVLGRMGDDPNTVSQQVTIR